MASKNVVNIEQNQQKFAPLPVYSFNAQLQLSTSHIKPPMIPDSATALIENKHKNANKQQHKAINMGLFFMGHLLKKHVFLSLYHTFWKKKHFLLDFKKNNVIL